MKKSIDQIKDLKDIFKITKPSTEEQKLIAYKGKNKRILGAQAHLLAELIAQAYNEGSHDNYWWGYYKPGSGFCSSDFSAWFGGESFASSRLRFETEEKFLDATNKFAKVYKTLMEK